MEGILISYTQFDFSGGMNLFDEDFKLAENEYKKGYNVRNRTGSLEGILGPRTLEDVPAGYKQGLYGFENFLVLFVSGRAYYYVESTDTWTAIPGFQMSSGAEYIYGQVVPASSSNLLKKLKTDQVVSGTSSDPQVDTVNTVVNGTPAGMVVQDGITQPRVILPDTTQRLIQTFAQWSSPLNREYVPVGLNMAYMNGILFIVKPDRKGIYRSVTGRPLDFAVNVDVNGNKGGTADSVEYSCSYDEIKCLNTLKTGRLLVGTEYNLFPIEFDYDRTIFQEPTFLNREPINVGVVNQHSFVDMINDYGVIDFDGIKSFNAVTTLGDEGRNGDFSLRLGKDMFANLRQDVCASVVFDNYAIFSVNTSEGYVLLVYDLKRGSWVSIDTPGIHVKQFAITRRSSSPKLYAIDDNNVYQIFGGPRATAQLYPKSIVFEDVRRELRLASVRPVFAGGNSGNITITEIVDDEQKVSLVSSPAASSVDNINKSFQGLSTNGFKISSKIAWANANKLTVLQVDVSGATKDTSNKQQAKGFST